MAEINASFYSLSQEKQERIVNAALAVFAQFDYRHASTDDIAAQADISKGLLFYYFKNKQTLYLYCYDYALELVHGEILQTPFNHITDFFELMEAGAFAKLKLVNQSPWLLDFSLRAYHSQNEAVSDMIQQRLNHDLSSSFELFFKNIDLYKFRPGVDVKQVLQMLTWMTEGYLRELLRTGAPLILNEMMQEYHQWADMFRTISYKEEFLP